MIFLPVVPNWVSPIRKTYDFNTEIIESSNGREQRIAHRRKPRVSLKFSTILPIDLQRSVRHILGSTFTDEVIVIDPINPVAETTGSTPAGVTVVGVNKTIPAGTYAIMDGLKAHLFEVTGNASNAVNLRVGLPIAIPSGAVIYSTLIGSIGQSNNVNQVAGDVVLYDMVLRQLPEDVVVDTIFYGQTYEGYPLLDVRPNWQRGISFEYNTPVDEVDYGNGVIASFQKVLNGNYIQNLGFTISQSDDLSLIRSLFMVCKGQQGQFLCPTFTEDMKLLSDVTSARQTITVRFQSQQYIDDLFWITFFMEDGKSFCRRVTSATQINDTDHQLMLNEMPPVALPASSFSMLSQTRMARFASDSLTISHVTSPNISTTVNNVKTTMTFDLHVWNDLNIWSDEKLWRDHQ